MEIRLSIIIPFYNAAQYIGDCIESLYKQNIKESEFEVICVNDCSPEQESKKVILDFQQEHSNIVLVEHGINKMTGGARNTGLEIAKGKYVWFIDSDDFIEQNSVAKMLEIAEKNCLDILEFNAMHYYKNRTEVHSIRQNSDVITGIDFIFDKEEKYEYKSNSTWCKFFLRDFLNINQIRFQEKVRYEDVLHSFVSRIYAKRYMFVNDVVYHYRFNSGSYTQSLDASKIIDFYNDNILVLSELIKNKSKIESCGYNIEGVYNYYWKIINNYKPLFNLTQRELRKFIQQKAKLKIVVLDIPINNFSFMYRYPFLLILASWVVNLIKKLR